MHIYIHTHIQITHIFKINIFIVQSKAYLECLPSNNITADYRVLPFGDHSPHILNIFFDFTFFHLVIFSFEANHLYIA